MTDLTAPPATIAIALLSDTTFGSGQPTAGEVDMEIDADEAGLPRISAKAIHGLLRSAWDAMAPAFNDMAESAADVLGTTRDHRTGPLLRVGTARVDAETRAWADYAATRTTNPIGSRRVLDAMTDIRIQTAMDRRSGAPARRSLRMTRVVSSPVAGEKQPVTLIAPLNWLRPPDGAHIRVLALMALGVRHGGVARSRGSGHIQLSIDGDIAATVLTARGSH